MMNILKISLLATGISFVSSLNAQDDLKTAASKSAAQMETPATPATTAETPQERVNPQEPAKTSKQEPAKATPAPAPAAASKTEKADTAKGGGTRMAISEQGLPKKKKKSSAAPPAAPPKK